MAEQRCSKQVYSGERWDFNGHPCSRKGTVERDGKWWCGQHDPEKVAAREEKRRAKLRAEHEREEATRRATTDLIARIGAGQHHYGFGGITGGVVLTAEEASALADRLERMAV